MQYNDPVVTLLAGAVAGCCSRTATAPLDRVKVIVQVGHLFTAALLRRGAAAGNRSKPRVDRGI